MKELIDGLDAQILGVLAYLGWEDAGMADVPDLVVHKKALSGQKATRCSVLLLLAMVEAAPQVKVAGEAQFDSCESEVGLRPCRKRRVHGRVNEDKIKAGAREGRKKIIIIIRTPGGVG